MGRTTRVGLVLAMLGGFFSWVSAPPAQAASTVDGLLGGSGSVSPGLSTTPTFQNSYVSVGGLASWTSGSVAGVGGINCVFTASSTIAETLAQQQGLMGGGCYLAEVLGRTDTLACPSAQYARVGSVMLWHAGLMSPPCILTVAGVSATVVLEAEFIWMPTSALPTTTFSMGGRLSVRGLQPDPTPPTTTSIPTTTTSIPPPTTTSIPTTTTSVQVTTTTTVPVAPIGSTYPSDDCAAGQEVAEGWVSGGFVRVRTHQPDSQTALVCYRVDNGATGWGGKVQIVSTAALPAAPTVDSASGACASTPGNSAPGPHPILSGFLGDPSDPPTYAPYLLDTYGAGNQAWVCLRLGTVQLRVATYGTAGAQVPTVTPVFDATPGHAAPPTPDGASPSGSCQAGPSGVTRLVNASVGPSHAWVHARQPSPSVTHVCLRTEGPVSAGGRLVVDAGNTGGAPSVVTSVSDMTPCTVNVLHNDSPAMDIRRSPTGVFPASICVIGGGQQHRVTVTTGNGQPPASVDWEPNPGTPG